MAHMSHCLEIASKAAAEKKRYSLAIIYDEVCRKEWSIKAARGARVVVVVVASCCSQAFADCLCIAPLRWQVTEAST